MLLSKAALPITDISIARGYAVFDAMLAIGQKPLHAKDHIKRFFDSAKASRINIGYSQKEVLEAILSVLQKNKLAASKVRVIATGGNLVNGLEFDPKTNSFFVIAEPYIEPAKIVYENGISLITAEYQRPLAHAKTTNYMAAVHLQEKRIKNKAFEILYTQNGNISECSTSNFFIVKGDKLFTPKDGILKGIIRKFVLNSASKVGLKVIEKPITLKDLAAADEAFISASYKGVIPVVKVDNLIIGNGKVGHAAQTLAELYKKFSV